MSAKRLLLVVLAVALPAAEELQFVASVPMRDGVRLSTNVFLPPANGRSPVLLVRTPYGKGRHLISSYRGFIRNGFAVVVQDVRGRYDSPGEFDPLMQEGPDGSDTLDWIAQQPWSNGSVGMLGGSYLGIAQWRAALTGNPHLKAIFPVVSGYDEYFDRFYSRGGAVKFGHRLLWISENVRAPGYQPPPFSTIVRHLPIRTSDQVAAGRRVGFWQRILDHPTYDAFWRSISTREHIDKVRVPAFIVTGWYDNFAESDLEAFAALSARAGGHRIVVGPWGHNMSIPFKGEPFGRNTGAPVRRYQIDWFNYWMKTPQPAREFEHPPVRIFVMGLNKWRDEREWPLLRARPTPFYLSSEGGLALRPSRGGRDQFTYDPRRPAPTMGGAICCNPKIFPWGPMDQQGVEARDDVLVYSTAPLASDIEVTGPVRVVLHVSTSAPDTDFTAKLVDVFPDGYARNLCDGILRLRYRKSLESAELARPGEVYAITIQAGVTSNLFRAGHRIRLEVSSSNFPRFDRNPNTGTLVADERLSKTARQTVYYGGSHASHVLLPIVPVK